MTERDKIIEQERKGVLELMLKKAGMSRRQLTDDLLGIWMAGNNDLLADSEKVLFPHLSWSRKRTKTIEKRERKAMIKEVQELIMARSGVTRKDILNIAMSNFCRNNIDLLTAEERCKYASVIL